MFGRPKNYHTTVFVTQRTDPPIVKEQHVTWLLHF